MGSTRIKKIEDVKKHIDDIVCICLNCLYVDIALTWKENDKKCISCKSKAVSSIEKYKKSRGNKNEKGSDILAQIIKSAIKEKDKKKSIKRISNNKKEIENVKRRAISKKSSNNRK